jgi:hypothetical protein
MSFASHHQLPLARTCQFLVLLFPLGGTALATQPQPVPQQSVPQQSVPLPPASVWDALAAMPELQPAGLLPLSDGLTLHLAVPIGDRCSPQAAWLICPGLRLASRGTDGGALVLAAWHTTLPDPPPFLAGLRQAALDRHGPPAWEERVMERRWGLDLALHRMGWTLPGRDPKLRLEAVFVLEDPAGAAPRV